MFHQVCAAILPPQRLVEVFRDWDEIAEGLAEPARARFRYVFKLTLIGQRPALRRALGP
jgi:hypothetical protein